MRCGLHFRLVNESSVICVPRSVPLGDIIRNPTRITKLESEYGADSLTVVFGHTEAIVKL